MAAFYFFGFAVGMFHKETADKDTNVPAQTKNIHVEQYSKVQNETENSFYFHQLKVEKKAIDCSVKAVTTPPPAKEKLIYFVHDIKIPHSSISDFYFCRPPPSLS